MKAELKNLAKESFLEELERLRMASPSHFSNENYYNPNDLDRQSYLENELQRLQSMVGDARKQTHHPGNGANPIMSQPPNNHLMNVEWSSPIVRDQMTPAFPPLLSSQAPQHHFGGGFATPHHQQNHFFGENSNELDPPFHNNNEEIGLPVLGSSNYNNNPQNQHFVLSCAPIQGFNELIKQETNLFRDAMSFSKTLNNNPTNAGGSPTSTLNNNNNNNNNNNHSLANPNMSLLEQANRFAEMQSLFQLPNSSSLNNHHLLQFNPNSPHNHNPNPPTDTDYYSLSQFLNHSAHFQEENQKSIQQSLFEKQQRMDKEQKQHKKLKNSIDTHKDRLGKGRNPVRRFPMTGPPPTSSASNRSYGGSRKSPRTMRLQQQRGATAPEPALMTGNQEEDQEQEEEEENSPKSRHHHNHHHSHNQEDRSRSNSPKATTAMNRQFPNSAPAGPQQNQFSMNMSISSLGTNNHHHINNNSNSPTSPERQNQTAPAAPKPIQTLTFEEFKTKTDK
jgi:hypothetical protein